MAFADLLDVEDLLDFELDEQGQRQAVATIQRASDMARHYARPLGLRWADSRPPAIVKTIVINVVERYMRNPDGYTQSRAGDESLSWASSDKGVLYFTDEEKGILAELGRPNSGGVYSVQTYQHSLKTRGEDGWLPTSSGSYFPVYAAKDAPIWDVL